MSVLTYKPTVQSGCGWQCHSNQQEAMPLLVLQKKRPREKPGSCASCCHFHAIHVSCQGHVHAQTVPRARGWEGAVSFLRMRPLQKQVRTKNSLSLVPEINCLENCSMNAEDGSLRLCFVLLWCVYWQPGKPHPLKHPFSLPLVHAGTCLMVFTQGATLVVL